MDDFFDDLVSVNKSFFFWRDEKDVLLSALMIYRTWLKSIWCIFVGDLTLYYN
jgi:hypothetical protein